MIMKTYKDYYTAAFQTPALILQKLIINLKNKLGATLLSEKS